VPQKGVSSLVSALLSTSGIPIGFARNRPRQQVYFVGRGPFAKNVAPPISKLLCMCPILSRRAVTCSPASRERSSNAEAHDVSAEVGRIAFSGRRSQQPRRKHPRAATIHTEAFTVAVVRFDIATLKTTRSKEHGVCLTALFDRSGD
jgi:hypothetical protein